VGSAAGGDAGLAAAVDCDAAGPVAVCAVADALAGEEGSALATAAAVVERPGTRPTFIISPRRHAPILPGAL
jgi:hypothetical protein